MSEFLHRAWAPFLVGFSSSVLIEGWQPIAFACACYVIGVIDVFTGGWK